MKPILVDMSTRLVWVESEHGRVAVHFRDPAELWKICTNPTIASQTTKRPLPREAAVVYESLAQALARGVTIQKVPAAFSKLESERVRRLDVGELLDELGLGDLVDSPEPSILPTIQETQV